MAQHMSASGKLRSEQVVIQSPMSFIGSAKRIWKLTDQESAAVKYPMMLVALVLIFFAWIVVAIWTYVFGIFMWPFRIMRRGSRKEKVRALQHREQLEALTAMQQQQTLQTAHLIEQNKQK